MNVVDFVPPRAPSVGPSLTVKARVNSVELGDGYSVDSPDGINTLLAEPITLPWKSITEAQADALDAFFQERNGVGRFRYAVPGLGATRLFKCTEWTRTPKKGGRVSYTAKIKEVVA